MHSLHSLFNLFQPNFLPHHASKPAFFRSVNELQVTSPMVTTLSLSCMTSHQHWDTVGHSCPETLCSLGFCDHFLLIFFLPHWWILFISFTHSFFFAQRLYFEFSKAQSSLSSLSQSLLEKSHPVRGLNTAYRPHAIKILTCLSNCLLNLPTANLISISNLTCSYHGFPLNLLLYQSSPT